MTHNGHDMHNMDHGSTAMPMDHSAHTGHEMSGMGGMDMHMKMYFHTTLGDRLLFENWILSDKMETFGSCIVFITIAVLYEGLKAYREYLFRRSSYAGCYSISVINQQGSPAQDHVDRVLPGSTNRRTMVQRMLNGHHMVQTILHIVQVLLSYTLMLGFMTFNVWICIAILIGAGLGYFLFCWRKITIVDVTEHCH